MDANCNLVALAARAPDPWSVALTDSAVRSLGGRALTGIIESCDAIDPWTAYFLDAWRWDLLVPHIGGPGTGPGPIPSTVLEQARRTCGENYEQYEQVGPISHLPGRERGYVTYESCGFEARGILKASDLDHVRPPLLGVWRVHQMLLESRVPKNLANRYFTAILLGLEALDRAPGTVDVRNGQVEVMYSRGESSIENLDTNGRLEVPWHIDLLDHNFHMNFECVGGALSIAATEPIGNLRWLLDRASEISERCADEIEILGGKAIELAVSERDELFRPLRAEFDVPAPGPEHRADLELVLDSSGAWHTVDGTVEGRDPTALTGTLDRLQPSSLRVRTSPSTSAATVVDLLRVPDVWSARGRRELELWLWIEDDTD